MDAAKRFIESLEGIQHSSFRAASQQQYDRENSGQSGYFIESSAGRARDPQHGYLTDAFDDQPYENLQDEPPLDDFDRQLLAERSNERQWQASQGMARLSLPSSAGNLQNTTNGIRMNDPDEPYATPPRNNNSSSSPFFGPMSTPTKHMLPSQGSYRTLHGPLVDDKVTRSPIKVSYSRDKQRHASEPTNQLQLCHAPPVIQGIPLVPTTSLPDRFHTLFPYPIFNAIQSKIFETAFNSDDNLVLSAPTGSGKTVVMELAICRLVTKLKHEDFKIVYQAPTKSLCNERYNDWNSKFRLLGLTLSELTGDTQNNQLKSVQNASIIITTPEKWDSITRKWKDHAKLMQMVRLFLIDEVHILRDSRGATLEAVVSRMKSVGNAVRFIALSATVPNSEDIAIWLGRNASNQHLPACREIFGEEFRPTKLQKLVYGHPFPGNDFVFDKVLDARIPEVIAKHSNRKPVMIFCPTRQICQKTAKNLAGLWSQTSQSHRIWNAPNRDLHVQDSTLRQTVASGVAYHHAGLDVGDRREVEKQYLNGNLSIICCTSTLAVGVNLPCYLVIIKGTVSWTDRGIQEYPDLEMMQMLGRAGRPQFESSACAVILTRKKKVEYFQKLVSGQERLESCLHLNLIDHLNAEIGLGTVTDNESAKKWLAGTFLYVRLQRNPNHYRLKEGITAVDDQLLLDQICAKDIRLLQGEDLVTKGTKFRSTAYGDAMSRYYVKFETMRIFMALPQKAKMSEMISAIAQAVEFQDLRLKSGEKSLFKEINKDNSIKFPIKVDIALPAHKVSLLLQAELGGTDFPSAEQFGKHKTAFVQEKNVVLQNVNRLIRCIVDCQVQKQDSIAARHGLELARSFSAKVWDNSPLQLKQLEGIGHVAVRKFASSGINSIEVLEASEPHRIERALGKNPPFGMKLLQQLEKFPKLRVSVQMTGKEVKPGKPVMVKFKAEIGFLNEKPPTFFNRNPIFVCFLAEINDGRLVEFQRISANRIQNGHDFMMTAEITSPLQSATCYVMCDEVAGTLRSAELRLELPSSLFPPVKSWERPMDRSRRIETVSMIETEPTYFGDDDIDDGDLLAAESSGSIPMSVKAQKNAKDPLTNLEDVQETDNWEPTRMANGKWKCKHICKDRSSCKHLCCREGLDKRPNPPRSTRTKATRTRQQQEECHGGPGFGKPGKNKPAVVKATHETEKHTQDKKKPGEEAARRLQKLHNRTGSSLSQSALQSGGKHGLKLVHSQHNHIHKSKARSTSSSDYDAAWANEIDIDDLPDPDVLFDPSINKYRRTSEDVQGFDFSDPDLENLFQTVDSDELLGHTAEDKQSCNIASNANLKHGINTVDVNDNHPRKRPRYRLISDFLDDSDGNSSDTIGRDQVAQVLPPFGFHGLEGAGPSISSRSPSKQVQTIAATNIEAKQGNKDHLSRVPVISNPPKTNTSRLEKQKTDESDARVLKEIVNHTQDRSNGEGHACFEDEKARKQREQDEKWEGFDPDFVAQYKDLVELI